MAKFELKFLDNYISENTISTRKVVGLGNEELIQVIISNGEYRSTICLDRSTSIRFAKTIRTEINKIGEEGCNG